MADDDGEPGGKGPKTPKDEKRREQILIGAAIAGVLLTMVLVRRSAANAANANQQLPVSQPISNMNPGTGSGVSSGDFASLQNQVYGLQGTLSGLEVAMGLNGSPTGISTSPGGSAGHGATAPGQFTAQDVTDMFAQYGFANVPPDQGETSQQRQDRILRQLNSGARTPGQVQTSIAHLPGAAHN